jgi:MoaA/NifB/PqqE/SkfB family radical SAM enzyme
LVCGKPLFDNVIENIKRLVFLKKRYNSGAKIIFHVTIIPENVDEIPDAIVLANALGCDVINYNADTLGANLIRENREVQERLKERIANIISDKTVTIEFERENLIPLGLV